MASRKVLVIEDEVAIRDMLKMALELEGFECLEAGDIREGYQRIVDDRPDTVLLDWMLPGGSGIELMRRLQRDGIAEGVPIIMLTAKADQDNVVQGLEVGADDYITKPFAPREVIARINALLRRAKGPLTGSVLSAGALTLDGESHRVSMGDQPVTLGPTEFNLLQFFMSHPERAYTRTQLLDQVWGANVYVEERTVDVHIRRLRKALKTDAGDCSHLVQTVRGTGYRFSERAET